MPSMQIIRIPKELVQLLVDAQKAEDAEVQGSFWGLRDHPTVGEVTCLYVVRQSVDWYRGTIPEGLEEVAYLGSLKKLSSDNIALRNEELHSMEIVEGEVRAVEGSRVDVKVEPLAALLRELYLLELRGSLPLATEKTAPAVKDAFQSLEDKCEGRLAFRLGSSKVFMIPFPGVPRDEESSEDDDDDEPSRASSESSNTSAGLDAPMSAGDRGQRQPTIRFSGGGFNEADELATVLSGLSNSGATESALRYPMASQTVAFTLLFPMCEGPEDRAWRAPQVKYEQRSFPYIHTNLDIVARAILPKNATLRITYYLLKESLLSQLRLYACCWSSLVTSTGSHPCRLFSFLPFPLGLPITAVYPEDTSEDILAPFRRSLHRLLFLPMDRPFFRRNNVAPPASELSSELLMNPHESCKESGVNGQVSLIWGRYTYHHYMQDRMNDAGWGCAYRSLQTLASWFRFQGYTSRRIPTHREIQEALVELGDKPQSFPGSKQWIGSTEVSYVLNHLFGVTSKIMFVPSGSELAGKGRELERHFQTQGTPVMIGGGDLAHTILGVDFNPDTGDLAFLVLDPHYTGDDDLRTILNKGWCGNEGNIESFANNTGFMWDLAPEFKACLIFAEHRYYGASLPFGNIPLNDTRMGYLSSQQALADYVRYLQHLRRTDSRFTNSPVIAFGGSYGGMLSAWMRMKYPNVISSRDYKKAQEGCGDLLAKLWGALERSIETESGRSFLANSWKLCSPLNESTALKEMNAWLVDTLTTLAMLDYPYETNFAVHLPGRPVKAFCNLSLKSMNTIYPIIRAFLSKLPENKLSIDSEVGEDRVVLSAVFRGLQIAFNYSGTAHCLDPKKSIMADNLGAEAWSYQSCTEMVMPQCNTDTSGVFPNEPWNIESFAKACKENYGVTPRSYDAIDTYGGSDLKSATNIIFSNGDLDPWAGYGVFQSPNPSIHIIKIKDGAHHLDLRASHPNDPRTVIKARNLEKQIIRKWIKEWRLYYDHPQQQLEDLLQNSISSSAL
ncbi:unnamed protein product [Cyprideis torosa]|uniref:Uncharacterized protein n=1 Tax=Cyprideis torosa TaxID=163714 RepID=A0A7R8WGY3_9CRUS|nr:unnamed protein product [Cyprideis torosa]CAG0893509.1 unnamed protein product [Cyprideis torosa]